MTTQITMEEMQTAKAEFLNKVWTDETFRSRLENDPRSVFAEMGGEFPDDIEIRVVSDTDTVKYLHIPAPAPEGEVSDADLLGAQGGTGMICFSLGVGGSIGGAITVVSVVYETTKA